MTIVNLAGHDTLQSFGQDMNGESFERLAGWNTQTTSSINMSTTENTSNDGNVRVTTTKMGGCIPTPYDAGSSTVEVGPDAGDTRVVMGPPEGNGDFGDLFPNGSVSTDGSDTLNVNVDSYHHDSSSMPPSEHDRTITTKTVRHPGQGGDTTTKTVDGTTITTSRGGDTTKVSVGTNDDVDVKRNTDGSVDITVNGVQTHVSASQAETVVIESHGAKPAPIELPVVSAHLGEMLAGRS